MNSEVTLTIQDWDLVVVLDCLMTISALCSIAAKKAYQVLLITEKEVENQSKNLIILLTTLWILQFIMAASSQIDYFTIWMSANKGQARSDKKCALPSLWRKTE